MQQCTSECLTFLTCLLSNPGRFRLRGDSFWSQSLRGQTSEQPAGASQRLEVTWQSAPDPREDGTFQIFILASLFKCELP